MTAGKIRAAMHLRAMTFVPRRPVRSGEPGRRSPEAGGEKPACGIILAH
jgi:hypothetical protein